MRVIGWIFAVLLLLLGGGCTVLFLAAGGLSDRDFIGIWLLLGLLPLVAGGAILRAMMSSAKTRQVRMGGGQPNSDGHSDSQSNEER